MMYIISVLLTILMQPFYTSVYLTFITGVQIHLEGENDSQMDARVSEGTCRSLRSSSFL